MNELQSMKCEAPRPQGGDYRKGAGCCASGQDQRSVPLLRSH